MKIPEFIVPYYLTGIGILFMGVMSFMGGLVESSGDTENLLMTKIVLYTIGGIFILLGFLKNRKYVKQGLLVSKFYLYIAVFCVVGFFWRNY